MLSALAGVLIAWLANRARHPFPCNVPRNTANFLLATQPIAMPHTSRKRNAASSRVTRTNVPFYIRHHSVS